MILISEQSLIHILSLPEGLLEIYSGDHGRFIPAIFEPNDVTECAKILLDAKDKDNYSTQAQIIARAGNFYQWGAGRDSIPGVDAEMYKAKYRDSHDRTNP